MKNNIHQVDEQVDELNKLRKELQSGIARNSMEESIEGKLVAPGISARTYLRMLEFYGLLEEKGDVVRLKRVNSSGESAQTTCPATGL